ncbi:hypothetical protein JXA31_09425 [Candidatus Bathyarchaeota archaeon]|nr:hypothetical protein [Candidatus Bathyarchaeota archaeon]
MAKRHSGKIFIAILVVVIVVLAFIIFFAGSQPNQGATPGVNVGDEFVYDIRGFWSATDSSTQMPEAFSQLNMTELYKITVTEVSDPEVSIEAIWRFKNGTEYKGTGTVNVETGIYNPTEGFWAIYGANLKANDRIRPLGPDRAIVNETVTSNYGAGGTRETNRISLIREYYDADDPTSTKTEYININFDRKTGMLVDLLDRSVYSSPQQTLTITWKLRDTNVWTIS